jgi:hypothetical protein
MPDRLGTAEERDRREGDPEAEAVMGEFVQAARVPFIN